MNMISIGRAYSEPPMQPNLYDPTRPSQGFGTGSRSAGKLAKLNLQSILVSPTRRYALINGRTLTVGKSVSGAKIVEILPSKVILVRNGRKFELKTQYKRVKRKHHKSLP